MRDEARILRARYADSLDGLDRLVSSDPTGTLKFLGTVVAASGGGTLAAETYVMVNPTEIDGVEVEGGAVGFTPDTAIKIPGIVLGVAPVVGDRLVFSAIGGRWIARKRATGGGTTPTPGFAGCCSSNPIPSTLSLTFTYGGGLTSASYSHQTQDGTLTYATTPPSYTGLSGGGFGPAYYGPTFTDDFGTLTCYRVTCATGGVLGLSPVFPGFGLGSGCCTMAVQSCSPFLVFGPPNIFGGGGPGSCWIYNPPTGSSVNFGQTAGDSLNLS